MTVREATLADLPALVTFIRRELVAWGFTPQPFTLTDLRRRWQGLYRYALLDEGGAITAALSALPGLTDRGPAYEVRLWLVAFDHPDKVKALDALALWACNTLRSEGVRIVISRRDLTRSGEVYGRDMLGMAARVTSTDPLTGQPVQLYQEGDTEAIIQRILQRRPEWALSL